MNKTAKAAVKAANNEEKAKRAAGCACPFCDDEITEDKTPLFCTPCIPCAPASNEAKKSPGKAAK